VLSKKKGRKYKLFRNCILKAKKQTRVLYNKHHVSVSGNAQYSDMTLYDSIISASEYTIMTHNQVEACRKIVSRRIRKFKRFASYYSPLRFLMTTTVKSKNSRMGKGKGKFNSFVSCVKAMEPIFVLKNVTRGCAIGLANKMRHKLHVALTVHCYTDRKRDRMSFSNLNFHVLPTECV